MYFVSCLPWLSYALLLLSWPAACAQTPPPIATSRPAAPPSTHMQSYQTDKFELNAASCAAEGYTMMLKSGTFICSDGHGFPVPSGHLLEGDWGASGTAWGVGDPMQPAPERLRVLYFSYAEDKFYQGEFALPQERIHELLQQGYWDLKKNQHGTYSELTVCVLPKGAVVVWLTGANQTLVGRFQAQEMTPTPAQFERLYGPADRVRMVKNRRAELPAEVQAQIAAGTVSAKQWDEYLKEYPWQVELSQPYTITRYSVSGVNAERTNSPLTRTGMDAYRALLLTPQLKPIPQAVHLYGKAEHGAQYVVRIVQFDEAETMAAFQTLHKLSAKSPITLFITVSKDFKKGTLTLKNEAKEIPLTKSPVEVLSED